MSSKRSREQKQSSLLKFFQAAIRFIAFFSPTLAGRSVNFLWSRTYGAKQPRREKIALDKARWETVKLDGMSVQTYIWGQGARTILLIHGWNGRGGQLANIALALSKQGFRVVVFDLPAHGRSAGKQTDLPAVSAVILGLEQHYGYFYAAVAHSFGSMCLMDALNKNLQVERAVIVSAPLGIITLVNKFASFINLSPPIINIHKRLLEQRFGQDVWREFSMLSWTKNLSTPGLVIHDQDDSYVEVKCSLQIAKIWQGSELMITNKLGHHRILADTAVIQKITDFIQA